MNIEYNTTDKDYIDFYEFNARNTPQGQKAMRTQKLAIPVILFLVILCTAAFHVGTAMILMQAALYVCFSYMWGKYLDKMIRKNGEGLLAKLERKGQKPYCPHGIIEFGEKEITDKRESQTLTLHYSDIASVYENGKAIYLYMTEAGRIVLLPADTLADDAERSGLMEILHKKIAPEKFMQV